MKLAELYRVATLDDNYLELVEVTYCNQTGTLSDSGEITPIRVPWNVVNNPPRLCC